MCIRNPALLKVLLTFLPAGELILLACAGTWTLPVFRLETRNASYRIGAQGYTLAGFATSHPGFAYIAPDDWPDEIEDISLWLLLHFILAILLLIYLVAVFASMFSPGYRYYRSIAITRPPWWTFAPGVILVCLVVALTSRDAALWGVGAKVGFKPDILGYFVIIGGIVLGELWAWAMMSAKLAPKEYAERHRDISERRHRSENDERRRRRRKQSWWQRMTRE